MLTNRIGPFFFDSKEREIEFRKLISQQNKLISKNSIRECFTCNETSLINSHSVPQFVLKNIAIDGKLLTPADIIDVPTQEDRGVNNAGAFQFICAKCDSQLFQKYENPENYDNTPDQIMLSQIVMKNSLKLLSKRVAERAHYNNMLDSIASLTDPDVYLYKLSIDKQLTAINYDIDNYRNQYQTAKKIKNTAAKAYKIIFHQVLDYVVPIAFQDNITLIYDLKHTVVNEVFNLKSVVTPLYVCIFPFRTKSVIIVFAKNNRQYDNFATQFGSLTLAEKLSTINYMMFCYNSDVFISRQIKDQIMQDQKIQEICRYVPQLSSVELSTMYNLSERNSIPNFLSQEYEIILEDMKKISPILKK